MNKQDSLDRRAVMGRPPDSRRKLGAPRSLAARVTKRAFTIVELMVVLTVVSVMATMCIPTFQRAIEQSRADIAAANLRAVWAAERLYWLEYRTYTDQYDALRGMKLLDTAFPVIGNYTYCAPVVSVDGVSFTATAITNSGGTASITIDQNGTITTSGVTLGVQFQ
ncbi:MAG: prepilin-type N-terminal cleavage/methylation domain-containing protein [Planctomycetaceae bacterium]|nr:prepilin-type N-terminal cleavage/methylation domain-containing protein [Planctomycetaceae bacterium]